jgi:outer membrane receptor protein involved in Fe transport
MAYVVSSFSVTGPGRTDDLSHPASTDTVTLKLGQFGKTYVNPEPRFSLSYNFVKDMSFKAAYSRNTQNIHLLSNTTTSNPTDR